MLRRGLLGDGGRCGVEPSAHKARTFAQTLLHLLLPAALPGRNCHPCFTDEQMGPKRGVRWATVTAGTWRSCGLQDSDTEAQAFSVPMSCPQSPGPVWPEPLLWERVSSLLMTEPRVPCSVSPSPLSGPAGLQRTACVAGVCTPGTQGQKPAVWGRGQVWMLPTRVSRLVYDAPAQEAGVGLLAGAGRGCCLLA